MKTNWPKFRLFWVHLHTTTKLIQVKLRLREVFFLSIGSVTVRSADLPSNTCPPQIQLLQISRLADERLIETKPQYSESNINFFGVDSCPIPGRTRWKNSRIMSAGWAVMELEDVALRVYRRIPLLKCAKWDMVSVFFTMLSQRWQMLENLKRPLCITLQTELSWSREGLERNISFHSNLSREPTERAKSLGTGLVSFLFAFFIWMQIFVCCWVTGGLWVIWWTGRMNHLQGYARGTSCQVSGIRRVVLHISRLR